MSKYKDMTTLTLSDKSKRDCCTKSCPPPQTPPLDRHTADVKTLGNSSFLAISHTPPVPRNTLSMIGGPKHHCVTRYHTIVAAKYRTTGAAFLGTRTTCAKKAIVVQNQANFKR